MVMGGRFNRFHPLVTFLYYVGSIALIFLMLHPVFLSVGIAIVLAINYMHDRLMGIRRWAFFLLASVFLMLLLNPLFNERGRHVLFEIGQHRFTLEAFVIGGMNVLSIITVIALFISYNMVMTPNKLLFLFAKVLPQTGVLLMLTLRFIPLMRLRMEEISLVQRSKGISVHEGTWIKRVKTGLLYVQVLLTYSLEEAIQTADSMKARGYGDERTRTTYEFFKINRADVLAIVILAALFGVVCTCRIFGYGFLKVYPLMESWHLSMAEVWILIGFVGYLAFPLLVEVGDWFRWR